MPDVSPNSLSALFPLPSAPPSSLAPQILPGSTPASAAELVRLLKLNHEKFHIFFNEKGFHNHLSHHLFAAYALGAAKGLITEAYEFQAPQQRDAMKSPEAITSRNWVEHLGDERFYSAYLDFFTAEISAHGKEATLENFIFSDEANCGHEGGKPPNMLARLVSGVLHPLIHLGHGAEFGMPGMWAEGLGMAAVSGPSIAALMTPDFFQIEEQMRFDDQSVSKLSNMAEKLHIGSQSTEQQKEFAAYHGEHSLTILSKILVDPTLAAGQTTLADSSDKFGDTMKSRAELLRKYCKEWKVDGVNDTEVAEKLEELCWLPVILFGVGGWRKGKNFKADFFLMHLITSSLFLSSYLPSLSPRSRSLLLRGHFSAQMAHFVARGRPPLPLEDFMASVTSTPQPPIKAPKPGPDALSKGNPYPDPWLPVIQSSLHHPEEHVLKSQRALAHYAALYGGQARKGKFANLGLPGGSCLDGELFVKVAGLIMGALGWVGEGEKSKHWDFDGLGWDSVWEPDYKPQIGPDQYSSDGYAKQ